MRSIRPWLLGALGLAVVVAGSLWWTNRGEEQSERSNASVPQAVPLPSDSLITARCVGCHAPSDSALALEAHFLYGRADLSRGSWAQGARVARRCGGCHAVPDPKDVPRNRWSEVVHQMNDLRAYLPASRGFSTPDEKGLDSGTRLPRRAVLDLVHYFGVFAPTESEMRLGSDPTSSTRKFASRTLGHPPESDRPPRIGHVQVVDLDRDGREDVLVSDFNRHAVTWIHRPAGTDEWREERLVTVAYPGRVSVEDLDGDGDPDLVIPDLGDPKPTDDRVGAVYVAINQGDLEFETRSVLGSVGRVADARTGDFDGDGDVDLVVGVFGGFRSGQIGWLERREDGSYTYHRISSKAGTVHVPPVDLDGDDRLDFVAMISQEHEEVTAFLNRPPESAERAGGGSSPGEPPVRFEPRTLFKADSPTFGSSGIRLTDLDRDGDTDVLYTNGDAYDLAPPMILPSHGVQWLENRGNLEFRHHRLLDLYGAYSAVAGDFDRDGDRDVAAVSLINEWANPDRKSVVWLENDGSEQFSAHGVASAPNYAISADVGDLDGDGWPDLVTGHMHVPLRGSRSQSRVQRFGRVTLWRNLGP